MNVRYPALFYNMVLLIVLRLTGDHYISFTFNYFALNIIYVAKSLLNNAIQIDE